MTKERKEYILKLFSNFNENKRVVELLSLEVSKMSEEEKAKYSKLKREVDIIQKVLDGEGYLDPNRKLFVTECLILGKIYNSVMFKCYVSDRTLRRWREELLLKIDSLLPLYSL